MYITTVLYNPKCNKTATNKNFFENFFEKIQLFLNAPFVWKMRINRLDYHCKKTT